MSRLNLAAAAISVGGLLLAPGLAEAHFKLNAPASWMSQDANGSPQKFGPCAPTPDANLGETNPGTPTGIVTAFTPGQTVSVSVTATVPHPGWWRISLHQGASSTQTLTTIPDPQAQTGTNCTPAFINNPVWSPTQPVLADKLGVPTAMPTSTTTLQSGTQTFQVTIPQNANCSMASPCTLQVVMIMTDHPATDCYYHHCADVAVSGTATGSGGMTGTTDAGTSGQGGAAAGTGGKTGAGGAGAGAGGKTGGTGGATAGTGGAIAGTGGATAGEGGATGNGSGGAMSGEGGSSGGQDSGTQGGSPNSGCGSCAVGGSVAGSSSSLFLLIALLALRRRRK